MDYKFIEGDGVRIVGTTYTGRVLGRREVCHFPHDGFVKPEYFVSVRTSARQQKGEGKWFPEANLELLMCLPAIKEVQEDN